jgi:hypothetical protein
VEEYETTRILSPLFMSPAKKRKTKKKKSTKKKKRR